MKSKTRHTLRYLWDHLRRYPWLVGMALSCLVIVVGLELLIPYFYKLFFDKVAGSATPQTDYGILLKILITITSLHLLTLLFRRLWDYVNIPLYSRVMSDIFYDCFSYLHGHSHDFFTNNFAGSLVKRVGRMVSAFESMTDKMGYEIIPLFLRIMAIFLVLLWLNPVIGLSMLLWTFLFLYMNYRFTLYKWKYDIANAKADTRNTSALADTIVNSSNVKLFAGLSFEKKRFRLVLNDWMRKVSKSWTLGLLSEFFQGLLMILLEFIIFYAAIHLWKKGSLTVGDFVWIQAYLIDLFMRLWNFGRLIRDFYSRLADAEEMMTILLKKHEVRDLPGAKPIHIIRGAIEFWNVHFAYPKNEPVIDALSLKIKPGEKAGLIGPSGGGKSTITKLLLRFFDIQKGYILIDGQDIRKVTQESLRSQISFVPQDPVLFHRTLLENIRYGRRDASDEEVIAAAKMAHCHDFIVRFPLQYQTYVGERGIKLSGGERQRVAIARAILANAPILVLDEATSSLDSESERLIQSALANLMKNKTTLVIAHRLSTIMKMDRILALQNGRLVEEGTHSDLLSKETGLYKKLWDLQMGGYVEE